MPRGTANPRPADGTLLTRTAAWAYSLALPTGNSFWPLAAHHAAWKRFHRSPGCCQIPSDKALQAQHRRALQYAAIRAPDQDQGRIAGEPDATEFSAAVQRATGTANFNRRVPAKAATDPPLPQTTLPARSRAEAALRFSRRTNRILVGDAGEYVAPIPTRARPQPPWNCGFDCPPASLWSGASLWPPDNPPDAPSCRDAGVTACRKRRFANSAVIVVGTELAARGDLKYHVTQPKWTEPRE